MVAKIKSSPSMFDTSAAALKELKDGGAPDAVIIAMVEASAPKPAPAAAANVSTDEFAHLKVYRARRYMGSGLAPTIFVDGVEVTRIGNGRRASIRLKPGSHEVRSDDKSSVITLDAQRGKEYYVRVDEETGFWKGHGKLTMVAPEQGVGEFKQAKPVEDDRRFAKELLEPDSETPAPDQAPPKP